MNSSQDDFLGRPKLVADVVLHHAELAALGVFSLQPLDEAGLMHVLEAALAVADLLEKYFLLLIASIEDVTAKRLGTLVKLVNQLRVLVLRLRLQLPISLETDAAEFLSLDGGGVALRSFDLVLLLLFF